MPWRVVSRPPLALFRFFPIPLLLTLPAYLLSVLASHYAPDYLSLYSPSMIVLSPFSCGAKTSVLTEKAKVVEEDKWEEEQEKRQKSKKKKRIFSFEIFSWLKPVHRLVSLPFSVSFFPLLYTHTHTHTCAHSLSPSLSLVIASTHLYDLAKCTRASAVIIYKRTTYNGHDRIVLTVHTVSTTTTITITTTTKAEQEGHTKSPSDSRHH